MQVNSQRVWGRIAPRWQAVGLVVFALAAIPTFAAPASGALAGLAASYNPRAPPFIA